jgi:hypothetical protein
MAIEDGFRSAAQTALATQPAPPAAAEQLDLLGMPSYRDPKTGQEITPRPQSLPLAKAAGGRPAGSRNRRTDEWIAHLLGRYPSPLEGLLQMGNLGIEALARSLGCTLLDAAKLKAFCLKEAAPYLHARLSSVEVKAPGDPASGVGAPLILEAEDWAQMPAAGEGADRPED